MPRKNRQQSSSGFYHSITRGVIKRTLFHKAKDYNFYLRLMREHKEKAGVVIYHYCLMANHAHVLLYSSNLENLSKFIFYINRRYAYYYQRTYKWEGQVFQGRFRSSPINDDAYLLECGRYIEKNPCKAGIVENPEDYPYSSYRFYAARTIDNLLTTSPAYLGLAETDRQRIKEYKRYLCANRPTDSGPGPLSTIC